MMLKKACAFISCALFLAACTTPLPKYKNPHPSAEDAHLTFESDFEYHTFFSVNIRNTADACGRFESAGYLLKVDSIFIFDKPNKEVSITVPSQQMVESMPITALVTQRTDPVVIQSQYSFSLSLVRHISFA
ncbi:hypothetical protein [Hydrogenophaga aquatica]